MENWSVKSLKEQIWIYRILFWFILIVYFFPMLFLVMAGKFDLVMCLWGGSVTALGWWICEDKYKEIRAILASRNKP